jgi:hypothetical protein
MLGKVVAAVLFFAVTVTSVLSDAIFLHHRGYDVLDRVVSPSPPPPSGACEAHTGLRTSLCRCTPCEYSEYPL